MWDGKIVNRILYADQFTDVVSECRVKCNPKDIDEVFAFFKPRKEIVELETEEGDIVFEDFVFQHLSDFDDKQLIANSKTLSSLYESMNECESAKKCLTNNLSTIHHEILSLEKARQMAEAEVAKQKRHIFSYLTGHASYSYGIGDMWGNSSSAYSATIYQYQGSKSAYWNIGVGLAIPVEDILDLTAAVKRKRIDVEKAVIDKDIAYDQLKLQIATLFVKITNNLVSLKTLGEAEKGDPVILLAHDPTWGPVYSQWGADLTLSGHYHGGVIRFPLIGGFISPRWDLFPHYDYGMYQEGENKMLVTSGLGQHTIPVRFNNLPEMVLIDIV